MIEGVIHIGSDAWHTGLMRHVWLTRDSKTKALCVNVLWLGNDEPEVIIKDNVLAGQFQTQYQAKTGAYLSVPA